MKRIISIVGLFLAAVFVLSAMAASSASAADLLARSTVGSIAGVTFLSSATLPLLWSHNGQSIHCKQVTNHGLFLSSTLGNVLIRFLGCTAKEEGPVTVNCSTPGAGTGEIHLALSTLFHLGLAHLGTNRTIPAIVILLGKTIEIQCSLLPIKVRGNVIGALQRNGAPVPLNTSFEDVNLNFQQTANGLQHLRLILMPGSTSPTAYDLESAFGGAIFELASEVANALLDGFKTSSGAATSIEFVEP
jgi:hypothetical protein